MKKRTSVDFSKHEMIIKELDGVSIHTLKLPNTRQNQVTFINTCGVMTVTGDFGNWVFCREFIPAKGNFVSDSYFDEKLEIASVQSSHKYDPTLTEKYLNDFESETEIEIEDESDKEEFNSWVSLLKFNVDSELDYSYIAYRETPNGIDYEYVPFGKSRHIWLNIVYDAFDELCNRL